MSEIDLAGPGRAGHRRLARHRPRDRAGRWPQQGLTVIGTATTDAGAAGDRRGAGGLRRAAAASCLNVNDGAARRRR